MNEIPKIGMGRKFECRSIELLNNKTVTDGMVCENEICLQLYLLMYLKLQQYPKIQKLLPHEFDFLRCQCNQIIAEFVKNIILIQNDTFLQFTIGFCVNFNRIKSPISLTVIPNRTEDYFHKKKN